jgi:hypothetical protein
MDDQLSLFGSSDNPLTGREYLDTDVSLKSPYQYFMRVDPAMRGFLGPIESVDDPLTGRTLKKRWAKVAMIRGAKDENLKTVDVYLEPFRIFGPRRRRTCRAGTPARETAHCEGSGTGRARRTRC